MTIESLRGFVRAAAYWFARTFQLQLFLMLVSLPMLVAWGLPISYMSVIGNCLFTPFLTFFLLLASLMFFGQLCHIPYGPVAWIFNRLTDFWIFIMHYGSSQWLFGIAKLPLPVLIAIGIAPFFIVAYKPTRSLKVSMLCFLSVLMIVCGYNHILRRQTRVATIPCARGELTLITTPHATVLIDPGYLGSRLGICSWVRYTLIPQLIATTGTTHINHFVLLQPMGLSFEAAQELCTQLCVDRVYIPCWDGPLKPSHKIRYKEFKNSLKGTATSLVRLHDKILLSLSEHQAITIIPDTQLLRIGSITFPVQKLQAQIDNNEVTLYSAKYMILASKQAEEKKRAILK